MFTSTPRSVKKKPASASNFQLPPVPALKHTVLRPSPLSETPTEPPSFLRSLYPSLSQDGKGKAREEVDQPEREQEMDVEPQAVVNRNPNLLLKNEKHAVSFLGPLPTQVAQLFSESNFYQHSFRAHIFPQTGHAMVISREACFVWSYKTQLVTTPPTCYVFPFPLSKHTSKTTGINVPMPFAAIVPPRSGTSGDAGLLACSPEGEFWYWESLALLMGGGQTKKSMQIYLAEGQYGLALVPAEPAGYIFATQHNLFRISLVNASGATALSYSPMSRPVGVFQRMGSLLGYNAEQLINEERSREVVAVVAGGMGEGMGVNTRQSRDIWVLTRRGGVQKWVVNTSYNEKFIFEYDVYLNIMEFIKRDLPNIELENPESLKLELLDLEYTRQNTILILVSYIGNIEERSTDPSAAEIVSYALLTMVLTPENELKITDKITLKFTTMRDIRPNSTPRLALPNGGPAIFIVFLEAIVTTTLLPGSSYEESVPLRDRVMDHIVGFGVDKARLWTPEVEVVSTVTLVASKTGLLEAAVNVSALRKEIAERPMAMDDDGSTSTNEEVRQTEYLRSKLEQAVFFGGHADNPLSFDISVEFEGDLDKAALKLSSEILESRSKHIAQVVELKLHLQERLNRMTGILAFIKHVRMVQRLSQDIRHQLCWNAEKMAAAIELWLYYNSLLGRSDKTNKASSTRLLASALEACALELGHSVKDDFARWFFRLQVANIGELFKHVQKPLKDSASGWQDSFERALLVHEANKIFLIVLTAGYHYREDNDRLYMLEGQPHTESWTARTDLIDLLQTQCEITERILRDLKRDIDQETVDDITYEMDVDEMKKLPESPQALINLLKDQMSGLADMLLRSFCERIGLLKSVTQTPQQERELSKLQERYRDTRPKVIKPLVAFGRGENAFELAERYRDFDTLVELTEGLEENMRSVRIQHFMGKFQADFGFILFEWYIKKGELQILLNQNDIYNDMLHEFLAQDEGHPQISWIHDIRIEHYKDATDKLVQVAEKEMDLEKKKTMLSFGKLTAMADFKEEDLEDEDKMGRISEVIDDNLDIIIAQDQLENQFLQLLEEAITSEDLESRTKAVITATARGLNVPQKELRAFADLYAQGTKKVLQGIALSPEEIIDMYTLKDNLDDQITDYFMAIEIFRRWKTSSDRTQATLRDIWRRIYLHDRWDLISVTANRSDEQLSNKLSQTAACKTIIRMLEMGVIKELILPPNQALFSSTKEDLRVRFAGVPDHQIDIILNDYQVENGQLNHYIEEYGLIEMTEQVERLAQKEYRRDLFST